MFTTKIFNVHAIMKMATKYEYGHRHGLKNGHGFDDGHEDGNWHKDGY